jgi:hypothetical protein
MRRHGWRRSSAVRRRRCRTRNALGNGLLDPGMLREELFQARLVIVVVARDASGQGPGADGVMKKSFTIDSLPFNGAPSKDAFKTEAILRANVRFLVRSERLHSLFWL